MIESRREIEHYTDDEVYIVTLFDGRNLIHKIAKDEREELL